MHPPDAESGTNIATWKHGQDVFKPATQKLEHMRVRRETVSWHKLVWFSQAIPRQIIYGLVSISGQNINWGSNEAVGHNIGLCFLCRKG